MSVELTFITNDGREESTVVEGEAQKIDLSGMNIARIDLTPLTYCEAIQEVTLDDDTTGASWLSRHSAVFTKTCYGRPQSKCTWPLLPRSLQQSGEDSRVQQDILMAMGLGYCGFERLVLTIHEIRMGRGQVVYSAMKCKSCGMVYPLQELAKGMGRGASKEQIVAMLKQQEKEDEAYCLVGHHLIYFLGLFNKMIIMTTMITPPTPRINNIVMSPG